jgi:hypothetical protein
MIKKSKKLLVMLCITPLFIVAGGCSSDDDPIQPVVGQVNQEQAEAAIKEAADFLVEFPSDIADLLEAIEDGKAGNMSRQAECSPLPGLLRDVFCDDPADGEICPGANESETVWNFDSCTGEDGGLFDGTVRVTEAGNTFDLEFDLDADGSRVTGVMQTVLGQACVSFTMTGLEIGNNLSITFNGSKTLCLIGGLSGDITAEVNSTVTRRFRMEIAFVEDHLLPVVIILDASTLEPLFNCAYSIAARTAECTPV